MKKKFALAAIAAIAMVYVAATPPGTGCRAPGTYLYAIGGNEGRTIFWEKMDSALPADWGSFDLNLGPGHITDGIIAVDRCSIYFTWIPGDTQSDIYRISVTGRWLTNLTDTPDLSEFDPWFSPDGQHILFNAYDEGERPSVRMVDRDGSNYRLVEDNVTGWPTTKWWTTYYGGMGWDRSLRYVALKPDGTLAAIVTADGNLGIVTVNPYNLLPNGGPTIILAGENLNQVVWNTNP